MASKQIKKKDTGEEGRPKKPKHLKSNPNSDEQVQLLLHLLLRARQKKLDILGIVWEDTDMGKSAHYDFFDLPKKELSDMLAHLGKIITLS